MTVDFEK
jgi:hypothetical protein